MRNIKRVFADWRYMNFPIGEKFYIVGTPEHGNIGDSAIVIAERNFLNQCLRADGYIKELTVAECNKYGNLPNET
jgi:exopolysaccharide biosynthesis predicted pyruvyltransferase EpsI